MFDPIPDNVTKFESKAQPGLWYWAEKNDLPGPPAWVVVSQVEGYPGTEAWDDWFAKEKDAMEIARKLANGELNMLL